MTMKNIPILLMLITLLSGCEKAQQEAEVERLRPVATIIMQHSTKLRYQEFSGVARAGLTSRLSFRISGKVETLNVKVGDKVKKGDLIATLSPSDYQLERQKSQAALNQATAEARNASASYRRIKSLYETETASRTELDNAQAGSEAAGAMVNQAENALALAKQRLGYTRLINQENDCLVASSAIESGENVSAGSTVVVVNCGNTMKVETVVSETFISHVKHGDDVFVQFNAFKDQKFSAVVTEVGVDAKGTAYPVTVALVAADVPALPGMAAIVFFNIEQNKDKNGKNLYLPLHTVQAEREDTFVYVLSDNNDGSAKLVKTTVEVGPFDGGELLVTSGLRSGQIVVSKGISQLYDGMRVKYQPVQSRVEKNSAKQTR